jgi:hypothetical protein
MINYIYLTAILNGHKVQMPEGLHWLTAGDVVLELLERTSDYFVFIHTKSQRRDFDNWLAEHELNGLVLPNIFKLPSGEEYVHNRRYAADGRKLRLVILKGKGNE